MWRDARLSFPSTRELQNIAYVLDKIWVPDTVFRNERFSFIHDITVDNKLLRITSAGDVWYVTK